jgi:1,4-alpha-glucan branching enzyme
MRSGPLVAAAIALAACGDPAALTSRTGAGGASVVTTPSGGAGGASATGTTTTTIDASALDAAAPDASAPRLPHPDLGANVDGDGVVFAVWAPNATAAWVESDAAPDAPMAAEDGGVFRARVAGAHAGTRYAFRLDGPSGSRTRLDPYARELDGGRAVVVDPNEYAWKSGSFVAPKLAESVVYELHVGSFAVPAGASHGTFASAAARLDDLADLGVNVVELMPAFDFGGSDAGWGYNPQLWLAPKPSYGRADDLRAFVDAAHARGIAVWMDVVLNHYDGWDGAPLHCFDGPCGGANGVYFFGPGPYAETPWGPRPDYTAARPAALLLDALDSFLVEHRGDGFRWDSVSNIRALDGKGETPGGKALILEGNARTHARSAIAIAEDLKGDADVTKPAASGGLGFDAQWDGFGWIVAEVLVPPSDDGRDMGKLESAVTGSYTADPTTRLTFLETHDLVGNDGARFPVRVDAKNPESFAARRRTMLGEVLLATSPGAPMLFQGEEDLATQGFESPPAPLAAPTARGLEHRAFVRDLFALRRSEIGAIGGATVETLQRNDVDKVLAYRRTGAGGDVVVIVNTRNKAYTRYDIGVHDAGPWTVRLNTESKAYGSDFSDGQTGAIDTISAQKDGKPFTLPLKLGAYAAMVLTR